MSYVVNAFACLVNIEIPGENMKGFVSNHTPDRIQISGGYFCMDTERFSSKESFIHSCMNIHHEKYRHISQLLYSLSPAKKLKEVRVMYNVWYEPSRRMHSSQGWGR